MGKPFDTFRITLMQNGLEDFFRNSCFGPKTNNLFGFPWAFMAWTFEVIPLCPIK
ncbi:hypothetical protein KY284_020122 [Solanum tuberosum]|nr:hypothetical protein KY284_020122 [Solanum tuberosum]